MLTLGHHIIQLELQTNKACFDAQIASGIDITLGMSLRSACGAELHYYQAPMMTAPTPTPTSQFESNHLKYY